MCNEQPTTQLVSGVEMDGQVIESTTQDISQESIDMYEKVKAAFKKYEFELAAFYEIGYEARILTGGRTAPLIKEELQDIIKDIGIDFIMVDFSDANFAWRVFYTSVMDPKATTAGID